MEKLNKEARRYLREIRSWIPCAGKMKREVLEEIRGTLLEFLSGNPEADFQALVARFGTPQQIASTYVDEAETGELLQTLRIRRKVVRIVCVTCAIMIALWLGLVGLAYLDALNQSHGYEVDRIDIIEHTPIE